MTKTALDENLKISWTGTDRLPLPQDRIILRKHGSYLTEINPTAYEENTYETKIAIANKNDHDHYDNKKLQQECIGAFSVEWIDEQRSTIAEGCLKTNPNWMEENKISEQT